MTENKEAYILGFDQYYYRKIIDLCVDYTKVYRDLGMHPDVPKQLSNMFVTILDFAHHCPDFPEQLRNPPLTDWNMYGKGVKDPLVIYPVCGIRYVMSVMNEILRQQGNTSLTLEELEEQLNDR
jgi:hypothetical protein